MDVEGDGQIVPVSVSEPIVPRRDALPVVFECLR